MNTPVLVGVIVAAALAFSLAMVALVRWLRPAGALHLQRFVIVNAALVAVFTALAVTGLIIGSWPLVGWSAALAIAMSVSAVSKRRQAAKGSGGTRP